MCVCACVCVCVTHPSLQLLGLDEILTGLYRFAQRGEHPLPVQLSQMVNDVCHVLYSSRRVWCHLEVEEGPILGHIWKPVNLRCGWGGGGGGGM